MESRVTELIEVAFKLDRSGLIWNPEIGDEVTSRDKPSRVAILVDPQGLTPGELREKFLWLPSVEQLVEQFEVRESIIYHAGTGTTLDYEVVVRSPVGVIETNAASLRIAFGAALCDLLNNEITGCLH